MNTSDMLYRAADLIEERGWTKEGGWFAESLPADAPLCAQGALRLAAHEATSDHEEWRRLYFDVLKPAVAEHVGESIVFVWNDRQTSAAPVIEGLRASAVIAAAREEKAALVEVSA